VFVSISSNVQYPTSPTSLESGVSLVLLGLPMVNAPVILPSLFIEFVFGFLSRAVSSYDPPGKYV